jgi:hypothetical protein
MLPPAFLWRALLHTQIANRQALDRDLPGAPNVLNTSFSVDDRPEGRDQEDGDPQAPDQGVTLGSASGISGHRVKFPLAGKEFYHPRFSRRAGN